MEDEFKNVTAFSQLYRDIVTELHAIGYMKRLGRTRPKQDVFIILCLINVLHYVQKTKIEATTTNVCFAIYCVVINKHEDIVSDGIEVLLSRICKMTSSHEFKNAYIGNIETNGLFMGLNEMDLFVPFLVSILNILPHETTLNEVLDSDFVCLNKEDREFVIAALGAGTIDPRLIFDLSLNNNERMCRLEEIVLLKTAKAKVDTVILPGELYVACKQAKQSFPDLFTVVQRSSIRLHRVMACFQGNLTDDDYNGIVYDDPSFYAFLGLGGDRREYWPACTLRMVGCEKIIRFSKESGKVEFGNEECAREFRDLEYGIVYFRKMGMENECTIGKKVVEAVVLFRDSNLENLPPGTQIHSQGNDRRFVSD
jgi:hypothetical protein